MNKIFYNKFINWLYKRYIFNFVTMVLLILLLPVVLIILLFIFIWILGFFISENNPLAYFLELLVGYIMYLPIPTLLTTMITSFPVYWITLAINKFALKNTLDIQAKSKLFFKIFEIIFLGTTITILGLSRFLLDDIVYICLIGMFWLVIIYPIIFIILLLLELHPKFRIKTDYIVGNKYYRICTMCALFVFLLIILVSFFSKHHLF